MLSTRPDLPRRGARPRLRGETARQYVLGSLTYSARLATDIPAVAPRALGWYRNLLTLGPTVPFGVVLDLGCLLLEGDQFHFRSFFADSRLAPDERVIREAYESRVLVRRFQEERFQRVRRLVLDNDDVELALSRVLELLLEPLRDRLGRLYTIEDAESLKIDFEGQDYRQVLEAFEAADESPGAVVDQMAEIAHYAETLDLDRLIQAEDLYEIQHIRVLPVESLREVARRIKRTERLLGSRPTGTLRTLRERALAETSLESVGTYPTGGIAELTTNGPIENLVPSELVYLDPDQPVDPFLLRFAENELLKYLRDSAVLRMMHRSVAICIEECAEFTHPLPRGSELSGTKVVRCLMGLVVTLLADLLAIFQHDDLDLSLGLVGPPGAPADRAIERQEIVEVLHLLLREKEEQGTAKVAALSGTLLEQLADARPEPGRFLTVIAIGRPESVRPLRELRALPDRRVVALGVSTAATTPSGEFTLDLSAAPLVALREARRALLDRVVG